MNYLYRKKEHENEKFSENLPLKDMQQKKVKFFLKKIIEF